jgi:CheY-like chemotaxis protein
MSTKNESYADSAQNEKKTPAADFSGLHILLVDDVATNRMVVKLLLAKTNIEVDEADGGEQALGMFAKSPEGYYDAVFMDIQMPDMDGFETTRRLRELPRQDARKTPVLAMTADAYEDMEESGRALMSGYLAKPIDINEMKRILNNLSGQ